MLCLWLMFWTDVYTILSLFRSRFISMLVAYCQVFNPWCWKSNTVIRHCRRSTGNEEENFRLMPKSTLHDFTFVQITENKRDIGWLRRCYNMQIVSQFCSDTSRKSEIARCLTLHFVAKSIARSRISQCNIPCATCLNFKTITRQVSGNAAQCKIIDHRTLILKI